MTRFGVGNFRQTYEGAVHTRNTYKNVALSIRTIRGSCPSPGADTRLGTKNLCEGAHCSYRLLHKVQCLKLKANCMLVLCTHPPVYVGLVPRERGDRSHPRQSTHLSPIYQQLVLGPDTLAKAGKHLPRTSILDPDDGPNPGSSVHILTA